MFEYFENFEDPGKRIKSVVKLVVKIQIVLCVLMGVAVFLLCASSGNILLGIIMAALAIAVGCLSAWFIGLLMYAFGDISERVASIAEKLSCGAQGQSEQEKAAVQWKEPEEKPKA